MKVLFIPYKYNTSFSIKNINLRRLPKKIGLVSTIQYTNSLKKIKAFLKKHNKKAIIGRPKNKSLEKGQILGCDVSAATSIQEKVEAFLYIGSGKFHPLQVALSTKKPIYIFNPLTEQFSELEEKGINRIRARKKGQKIKFLSSDVYGVLVSTKPGQNRLKKALKFKKKLEKKGKKVYIFLFNNLDINQLENYPSVECWVNTACPGLSLEHVFIWIEEIEDIKTI